MSGNVVITNFQDKPCSFLIKNNRLADMHILESSSKIGSIYIGKVKNVLQNIQAYFVEIADKEICFLPFSEAENALCFNRSVNGKLVQGDEILVQVSKDAQKTKQTSVTCNIAKTGTHFVFTVGNNTLGISNKLSKPVKNAIKETLVDRYPRDSYTLATKLHAAFIKTKEDRDKIFEEQMKKTGVEYFDYYLLHDMREEHYKIYEDLDCFSWIKEKKEKGLVKTIGFSFHDTAEVLDKVLTEHPEMEFVQLQMNYIDWESDNVQSRKCHEVAVKHGVPIIVMEPVKGGTLVNVPESVTEMFKEYHPEMSVPSWAIRFAASQENVMMVLSGMSNMEQLLDNIGYMSEFEPLNDEEYAIIEKAVEEIHSHIAVPCTGCAYCTDGCPSKIAIPEYFSLYNEAKRMITHDTKDKYKELGKTSGKIADCVECGQCEEICPQQLPIIEYLKEVEKYFTME